MICRECNGRAYVVISQRYANGVRRLRRCNNCGVSAHTYEMWSNEPSVQLPKAIYTEEDVKRINNKKVNARRKNEDRSKNEA